MNEYRVGGRTVATAATADHGVAALWNPSGVKAIYVKEMHLANTTAASAPVEIVRTTSRGTPGSTVAPDIDNDVLRALAPESGALLDLATYTVQPGLGAPALGRYFSAAVIGAGKVWVFRTPICVKAGAGLAFVAADGTIVPACDVEFVWEE